MPPVTLSSQELGLVDLGFQLNLHSDTVFLLFGEGASGESTVLPSSPFERGSFLALGRNRKVEEDKSSTKRGWSSCFTEQRSQRRERSEGAEVFRDHFLEGQAANIAKHGEQARLLPMKEAKVILKELFCLVSKSCPALLQTHGPQPTRLLCPRDFSGKNTGLGCHFLHQGIFLTQGWSCIPCVSCIGRQILYHQHHLGSPLSSTKLEELQQAALFGLQVTETHCKLA